MKINEAIAKGRKARAWLDRMPEYRAAIEALIAVAETRDGQAEAPKREPRLSDRLFGEMSKAWDEIAEAFVGDLPACDADAAPAEPVREPIEVITYREAVDLPQGSFYVACSSTGHPEAAPNVRGPEGRNPAPVWEHYRVLYRAPASAPAAPQAGDSVNDGDAARALPENSLLKGADGAYGVVQNGQAAWTSPNNPRRWPATVVSVGSSS